MANNQNVNKVVYGGNTIVDLTGDTVTAADVLNGKTFHLASGAPATGTADISGKMDKVSNPTANDILVTDGNGQAVDSGVKLADKQDKLVSGTNIKTVNNNSLVGSGNVNIDVPTASTSTPLMDGTASAGSGTTYARGNHRHPTDTTRQATLVSGTNIKTINGNSLLGSGDLTISPSVTITENTEFNISGVTFKIVLDS